MLPLPKQFAQWPGEASSVTLPRPRVAKQVRAVSVPGGTAWGPIGSPGSHAGPLLSAALNLPPPTPAKGSGSGRGGGRGRSTGPHKARAGRGEAEAALSQNRALRGRGAQARSRKPGRPPQERPRRPQRGDTHCRTTVRAKRFISPAAEAGDAAAGNAARPSAAALSRATSAHAPGAAVVGPGCCLRPHGGTNHSGGRPTGPRRLEKAEAGSGACAPERWPVIGALRPRPRARVVAGAAAVETSAA